MTARHSYRVAWQTALVWVVCLFVVPFAWRLVVAWINEATHYSLDPAFGGYFHALLFGLPAGGLLAGFVTLQLIRQYGDLPGARGLVPALAWGAAMFLAGYLPLVVDNLVLLPLTMSGLESVASEPYTPPFALEFALVAFSWLVAGLVGGWGVVIGLRAGGLPAGWRTIGQVALSWGAVFALTGAIVITGMNLFFWYVVNGRDLGWLINEILLWAQYGVIGLVGGPAGLLLTLAVMRQAMQRPSTSPAVSLDPRPLGPVKL